jgi:hypothetical protein
MDVDGNKKISIEELTAVLRELGMESRNLSLIFEEVDKNSDGSIDYEEFVDWVFKDENIRTALALDDVKKALAPKKEDKVDEVKKAPAPKKEDAVEEEKKAPAPKPGMLSRTLSAAATDGLRGIQKAALQELKSLGRPPAGVDQVVAIVMVLLGDNPKKTEWKDCQKALNDRFLERCHELVETVQKGELPEQRVKEAQKIKDAMGDVFTVEVMEKKSKAAAMLVRFTQELFD